jgi:hypothetical protein
VLRESGSVSFRWKAKRSNRVFKRAWSVLPAYDILARRMAISESTIGSMPHTDFGELTYYALQ